jgi:nucleoid DNA-binding protein
MAIPYKIVGCSNPRGAEGVDYACNRAVNRQTYTTAQIIRRITFASTLSTTDVVAVVTTLKEYIKEALAAGQNVVLDGFGIIYPYVRGKCFAQAIIPMDSFEPASYIQSTGIGFRPSSGMKRDVLTGYTVERLPSELLE